MLDVKGQVAGRRLTESSRRLARVVAAHCRGTTALLACGHSELAEALERRKVAVLPFNLVSAPAPELSMRLCESRSSSLNPGKQRPLPDKFDTVVLADALEYAMEDAAPKIVSTAWRMLTEEGRLIACVPNEDCIADPNHVQRFTQRRLKRLLKPFEQPRRVAGQPFKWLVMYVDVQRPVNRTNRERYQVIADLCHGRVIELGCGRGHLSKTIADRGLQVVGVDISEAKISKAREQYPKIDFMKSDILALSSEEGHYDSVVLSEVLEHVPEDVGSRMLAKAWDLVSAGGRLVVSVPNEDCVPHPNHVREFTRKSLAQELKPFGRPRIVTEQPFKWLLMYVELAD